MATIATIRFVARHAWVVVPLCLGFAFGRFAQTGYPGLGGAVYWALELLVEGGRVALALLVVGDGSVVRGARVIRDFFRQPEAERNARFAGTKERLQAHWPSLAVDFAVYLVTALLLNLAIAATAATSPMIALATSLGADAGNETTRVLLLKNISVIPLTIVFQVLFLARVLLAPKEGRN